VGDLQGRPAEVLVCTSSRLNIGRLAGWLAGWLSVCLSVSPPTDPRLPGNSAAIIQMSSCDKREASKASVWFTIGRWVRPG